MGVLAAGKCRGYEFFKKIFSNGHRSQSVPKQPQVGNNKFGCNAKSINPKPIDGTETVSIINHLLRSLFENVPLVGLRPSRGQGIAL